MRLHPCPQADDSYALVPTALLGVRPSTASLTAAQPGAQPGAGHQHGGAMHGPGSNGNSSSSGKHPLRGSSGASSRGMQAGAAAAAAAAAGGQPAAPEVVVVLDEASPVTGEWMEQQQLRFQAVLVSLPTQPAAAAPAAGGEGGGGGAAPLGDLSAQHAAIFRLVFGLLQGPNQRCGWGRGAGVGGVGWGPPEVADT